MKNTNDSIKAPILAQVVNTDAQSLPTHSERNILPRFRQKYPRDEADIMVGSSNSGVSITIPNETYTIRELLNKHTSGIMPNVERKAIYQEDVSHDSLDLQKVQRMDYTDKESIFAQQTDLIEQLEQQQKELKKEREQLAQTRENEEKAQKGTAESE